MNPPAASAVGDTGHLVWVPLSPWFRRKIRDAVEDAFLGHDQITTPLQETVRCFTAICARPHGWHTRRLVSDATPPRSYRAA